VAITSFAIAFLSGRAGNAGDDAAGADMTILDLSPVERLWLRSIDR
jgi:hypothetical protein